MAASGVDASNINAVDPRTGLPVYTERVRTDFASPQMQAALKSGGSSKVKIGNTEYSISGGKVMSMKTGGVVKPLILAGAIAGTAGLAGPALAGAAGAGAASSGAAGTAGAAGAAGGTVGATGAAGGFLGLSTAELARYGLSAGGNLIGTYLQSRAASNASEAEQKYLQEALAYEKEKDQYQRGIDAAAVAREEQRYGNYQGRIAPFIGTGTAANSRMASLLGLPAGSGGSGGATDRAGSRGVPVTPELTAKVLENYKALGYAPTGRGTGPTDSAYMADRIAEGGGLPDEAAHPYWFGPTGRIAQDLAKAGTPHSATPPASPAVMTPPRDATAPSGPVGGGTVQMRAPDGSIKAVPQNQVAHYQQLGATLLQGAA